MKFTVGLPRQYASPDVGFYKHHTIGRYVHMSLHSLCKTDRSQVSFWGKPDCKWTLVTGYQL